MKVIILCGGLGTRLGNLTQDMPKPLIHVGGRPFLTHVLDQLITTQVEEIVLAVGFHWQKIQDAIGDKWCGVKVSYSVELKPLGTGGAIKQAFLKHNLYEAIVVNGDTLLKYDIKELAKFSRGNNADIGIALKAMSNTARFGKVFMNQSNRIISFEEKGSSSEGLINSGIYYVKKNVFSQIDASTFSFEKDILAQQLSNFSIYGIQTDAYFIDMGVPEDLLKAQLELSIRPIPNE